MPKLGSLLANGADEVGMCMPKRIDRDATYPIENLIASLRGIGPQADAVWEKRRLSAIARLQSDVVAANPTAGAEAEALPPK